MNLTFRDFCDIVADTALGNRHKEVPTLIQQHGRKYSMVEHSKLDSLDLTEMLMGVEERLMAKPGFADFKLEGDFVDNAKNIGDIYDGICAMTGNTPDYTEAYVAEAA